MSALGGVAGLGDCMGQIRSPLTRPIVITNAIAMDHLSLLGGPPGANATSSNDMEGLVASSASVSKLGVGGAGTGRGGGIELA